MFRLFDNLVDPYANYKETDAPPTGDMAVRVPCRLVNILTQGTSEQVWVQSGTELILVVFFLLTLRPVMQAVHVLLLS